MDNIQNDDNWQTLIRLLPNGWEQKAIELKAILRFRNIPSVQALLRILFIHLAEGCSLRETAARAEQGRIANVSDVALLKHLKASSDWLQWIACNLLENLGGITQKPEWLKKYNVRIFDASVITEPGSTGTDWRLHYSLELFGLTCDYLEISSPQKGEKLSNFPINKRDLIIADRAYGYSPGLAHVIDHGGDFIIRLKNKAITLKNKDKSTFQLLSNLQKLSFGEFGDWEVYFDLPNKKRQKLRLIAIKKSPEAAANSIKRAKREMSKRQRTLSPETIALHNYFFLITSVSNKSLSACQILQLYRMRWQIELAFKRLKSILGLGHLPKTDPESAKAWLYGKLVVALLADMIVKAGRDFSPWGYPIDV
jgi:hypothetical protein